MYKNKIVLGTAQFGNDYGINNKTGEIRISDIREILDEAYANGIDTLDTAYGYGTSEAKIGMCNKGRFKIMSKIGCDSEHLEICFKNSLSKLNTNKIHSLSIHNFQQYEKDKQLLNILEKLKLENKIEKIGFSLYYPSELDYIIKHKIHTDIIQVPYNLLDRRFESYFPTLKSMGIEIHIRSVFLQGLFFIEPSDLNEYFRNVRNKITKLHLISKVSNITIEALCLNFAIINKHINKVIVGIDNAQHLRDIIKSDKYLSKTRTQLLSLSSLKEDNEMIIVPTNWK